MILTYGLLALFFLVVVMILRRSFIADRNFSDYAVGGRSFGAAYQAMSFLNTWYPGAVFIAFMGLAASQGVFGFYSMTYSLLTVVMMYLIARRVWVWGKRFDLKTQPDLFALRYRSRHIRTLTAAIGMISAFPWLILGMQSLGDVFFHLSLGAFSFAGAMVIGVAVMVVRQFWTIRMGMRGVVISDMFQGIVAYLGGIVLMSGLLIWLVASQGATFSSVDARMFKLPVSAPAHGSMYLFSLILTGAVGGWCWPYMFTRLFTADSVRSVKKAAVYAMPVSLVFSILLFSVGILASRLPIVAAHPEDVWFNLNTQAGGVILLALAGLCVFAATMGHVDAAIQGTGTQIANDLIGNYVELGHKRMLLVAKAGMLVITAAAAWIACYKLPALFSLAILSYQGIIQLAVPQFLGILWKRGNKVGAVAGMSVGFVLATYLEYQYPGSVPWAHGMTSGVVGILANLLIYVLAAYLLPHSAEEKKRIDELFASTSQSPVAAPVSLPNVPELS
jgi:SSS family solute:Na+ symporter